METAFERILSAGSFAAIRKPLELLEMAETLHLKQGLVQALPLLAARAASNYSTENPEEIAFITKRRDRPTVSAARCGE